MSCLPTPPKCINVVCMQPPREEPRTQPRNRPPQRQKPRKHPSRMTNDDDEKKKMGAGRGLSVGEEEEVRVAVVVRVQVEETQGEPQTPRRGFGFPQRLRERAEKRKHGVDETSQTKKKGHIQKNKHGSGLEGLKDHTRDQPQRQKRDTINQMTKPRP